MLGVCDESLGNVRGKSQLESGARQAKKIKKEEIWVILVHVSIGTSPKIPLFFPFRFDSLRFLLMV